MRRTLSLFVTLSLFGSSALADETETEGEETGYGDVVLTDGGPTLMEDKRKYENMVTLGMGFLPATIKASYRHLLSDKFSVMAGGGYGAATWTINSQEARFQRIIGTAGADFHPVGNGLHGFYLGPRLTYTQWSARTDDSSVYSSSRVAVRGIVGWRWILDPGIGIGLGLGGEYQSIVGESGDAGDAMVSRSGVGSALEFQLGWAF